MVALFVRLKLVLLRNQLRGSVTRVLLFVVGGAFAGFAALLAVTGAVLLRLASLDLAGGVVVVVGSLTVLAWAAVPLLLASEDDTSDPVRFALLPLPPARLAAGLLCASAVGVFPAATLLGALATVATFSVGLAPVLLALVCAPLAFLTCLLASRTLLTVASAALASRRGRELVAVVGIVGLSCFGLLGPALGFLGERLGSGSVDAGVRVLAWSPLGAVWAAPWAAAEGRPLAAAGRLGIALVTLVLLWVVYARALERRVRPSSAPGRSAQGSDGGRRGRDLLPDTPFGALVLRCLRYWRRDSRYAVSVIALPVVTVVLLLLPQLLDAPPLLTLIVGPFVAGMLALTLLNELAFDGSALWTTLAAGVPGRTERAARATALLLWALPVTALVSVAGTLLARRPDLLPAVLGLSWGVLLVGSGVAAVTSAWLAYPVPGPGTNPFTSNSGGGMAGLLRQGVALLADLPLLLPLLGLALLAWFFPAAGWLLLMVGPSYGAAVLAAGIRVGGDRFDRSGPELLSRLSA